ncbi:MAG: polysaccharide deacetylase family protein [Candidatus Magasanikbacteria bacterium]|nr:polysaccharide deacetylase family protein [Candidatus Magasanikbacteria bacterium]
MFYRNKIEQVFKNILTSGISQKIFSFSDGSIATILMLHRVDNIDTCRFLCNEHLKISEVFLENLILDFKKKGFIFVSIDELFNNLNKNANNKKMVVITLDDGYKDNITKGLPVFKKHNVPFVVYVTTGMVEHEFIYWWYLLEDLISQNNSIILSDGSVYNCKSKKDKEATFMRIRQKIMSINPKNFSEIFTKLFSNYKIDLYKYNDILPMSWEDVRLLVDEPLATVGSHTHSHINFKFFNELEIVSDIKKANILFKQKVNFKPNHFCYPYGDNLSPRDERIVKSLGFKTAVTASVGNIYSNYKDKLFSLPRIFVAENANPNIFKHMTWLKYKNK